MDHAENPLPANDLAATMPPPDDSGGWRWQLKHAVRTPDEFIRRLPQGISMPDAWRDAASRFPMLATPYYMSLIREWAETDPIFRQIAPHPAEIDPDWNGDPDALDEERQSPVPRLIHRYPNRAVLLVTDACAVRCRHCLRKRRWHFGEATISKHELDAATQYLRHTPDINEVLVSGGDPLTLETPQLQHLLTTLKSVPNVRVLRIGTRIPAVLPQRITNELCDMLQRFDGLWCATHFNHPHELTPEAVAACRRMLAAGVPMVNQTVLLRGVNDSVDTLRELCLRLLESGVKPYYLFHGDPIDGTRHFRTGLRPALDIARELARTLSGLAMPQLALDLPGGQGKVVLNPATTTEPTPEIPIQFVGLDGYPVLYPDQ